MPVRTPEDQDTKNPSQSDYNYKFKDIAKAEDDGDFKDTADNYDKTADPAAENKNIKQAEEKFASGGVNVSGQSNKTGGGVRGFFRSKKGGAGIFTTFIVGGGIFGTTFFGGMLAPITYFQNVVGDLDDKIAAFTERYSHIFRGKLTRGTDLVRGCSTASIRCKAATFSKKEVARLRAAGITVEPKTPNGFGRIKPESFGYKGTNNMSPQQFNNLYRESAELRRDVSKAKSLKTASYGARFVRWTAPKLGISRNAIDLRGSHQDRVKRLMANTNNSRAVGDLRFIPIEGESDTFRLEGDTDDNRTFSGSEVERSNESIGKVKNSRPPSRVKTAGIGALSVVGWYDMACTLVNTIGMAGTAAKVANSMQLAQYAMQVATLSDKAKAGDISPEDGAVLGEFFTQVDNREKIYNPSKDESLSVDKSGNLSSGSADLVDNPNYGKSAMDSSLYKMSAYGDIPESSMDKLAYSLGYDQNSLLSGVGTTADVAKQIINAGSDGAGCEFVQNPIARGVGIIGGIALGFTTAGGSLAWQGALAAGMIGALMIVDHALNSALSNTLIGEDMENEPVARGEATWTGMSVIQGEQARASAMMPGNSEQILTYQNVREGVEEEYSAIAREEANFFDFTNPHSFTGSLLQSLGKYISPSTSISSLIPNLSSMVFGGVGTGIFGNDLVKAKSYDPERFNVCNDQSYEDLGIDADHQCNVRYVMNETSLSLDPFDVIDYMENGGYVAQDTLTGTPPGYTPPDAAESQGFAIDMLNGFAGSLYENKYEGMSSNEKEYAYFLDYCVFRAMPFGDTFEETGAFGGAPKEYVNGQKCTETGGSLDYFRSYVMDISLIDGLAGDTEDSMLGDGSGVISDSGYGISLPDGEATELAQSIIDSGNVVDRTSAQQIKRTADGKSATANTSGTINKELLRVIAAIAQTGDKFGISSMYRDYIPTGGSTTSLHLSGKAFDVSGSYGINGNKITYSGHDPKIQEFINKVASVMPKNCQIGVPNSSYVAPTKEVAPSSCSVFEDRGSGAHLHFGVK